MWWWLLITTAIGGKWPCHRHSIFVVFSICRLHMNDSDIYKCFDHEKLPRGKSERFFFRHSPVRTMCAFTSSFQLNLINFSVEWICSLRLSHMSDTRYNTNYIVEPDQVGCGVNSSEIIAWRKVLITNFGKVEKLAMTGAGIECYQTDDGHFIVAVA